MISALIALVTAEETKSIIFKAPSTSAPRPNGYTFDFYKASWNINGKQLCDDVLSFFSTSFMPMQAKATVITLIPKKPHAACISDYRPIPLCNTFYKIVTKIIADRMKDIMPFIIHPSQTGFIKDKSIFKNSILAMEILGDFNLKASNNFFLCKI
ncbi:integrator complex subunit 11 [Dendrobium catenatum]|uniref:Integrator complex subunit 11 n=1 Tax=Dendrobium catenatum TaxID=906689 RepID=A0A2I0XCD9_9ASPA|nr:integrator complex subunit 11 [Dendrobium catenatum]